jgi:hypothetical protein
MFMFIIIILMYWLLNYRIAWNIHRNVIDEELSNFFLQEAACFHFCSQHRYSHLSPEDYNLFFSTSDFVHDPSSFPVL